MPIRSKCSRCCKICSSPPRPHGQARTSSVRLRVEFSRTPAPRVQARWDWEARAWDRRHAAGLEELRFEERVTETCNRKEPMNTKLLKSKCWLTLILGLCLCATSEIHAQQQA